MVIRGGLAGGEGAREKEEVSGGLKGVRRMVQLFFTFVLAKLQT